MKRLTTTVLTLFACIFVWLLFLPVDGTDAQTKGDQVSTNGTSTKDADLDDTTPAAPAGTANVKWQQTGSNPTDVSAHVDRDADYAFLGQNTAKDFNSIKLSTLHDWTQQPASISVGANTITLTPCPDGIDSTNDNHFILINETDDNPADEAVLITGGTCTSGAASGTVTFTASAAHTSGQYTLESATAGIQEAIWNSTNFASGGPDGAIILIPPGKHLLEGTLTVGNGTSTATSKGALSDYHSIKLRGAGRGIVTNDNEFATELEWAGASGGKIVVVKGTINSVEISDMRIDGEGTSGTILEIIDGDLGVYRDIALQNVQAGGTALDVKTNSFKNRFINVDTIHSQLNSSGLRLGDGNGTGTLGNSQNVFIGCRFTFSGNTSSSVGIELEAADNNSFYQVVTEGEILSVSSCTNASPIVVTTTTSHNRATSDSVNIIGVTGNTACNGTFTITNLTATTFSLDSSTGNGTYVSGGSVRGPGKALQLTQLSAPNGAFPHENAFYNSAFLRGFVESSGNTLPNFFLPFPSSDLELIDANTGANGGGQFVGIAHPDYNDGVTSDFLRLLGRYSFVRDDNTSAFATFDSEDGRITFGDLGTFDPAVDDVTVRRDGADASLKVRSVGSGNADLIVGADGLTTYTMRANRGSNNFQMFEGAGGDVKDFLEFGAATETTRVRGDVIEFYTDTAGATKHFEMLAEGSLNAPGRASDPVCGGDQQKIWARSDEGQLYKCEDGDRTHISTPSYRHAVMVDDFYRDSALDTGIGDMGWTATLGMGGAMSSIAFNGDHVGVIQLSTGSTTNNVTQIHLGIAGGAVVGTGKDFDSVWIFDPNHNDSNTQMRVGFLDDATGDPPVNGIYLEKLAGDSNWFGVTRASSNETRTSTGISVGTNFIRLRIRRVGSNVHFSIDGGAETTNSANVPAVLAAPVFQIKTTTTAAKTMNVDYARFEFPVAR